MIWILALIVLGVLFIDHRVSSLVRINRQILQANKEIAKALQWMVDNWEPRKNESGKQENTNEYQRQCGGRPGEK